MTVIKVEDMHCMKCVSRIEKLFQEENLKFSVDLESKTVSVDGDDQEVKKALEALDDLGFEGKL
ncbi:copper chaperone [Aequitasia blattaphilus]|uniref:Heavy-metal-associated domain-containing protein n=1 Tax=Aequitasia blattaphilus TaxID=2949332 RepID=A0ABT1E680_9FIRM|nr:heavy metal-associated domain-containing protein [Aequitasia blattaphilus]MCP1101348.1 heavy-metal-associated domain-containing protein [Aequitasia blattaphilus]MCR8613988.1 heavy-metal-associated domain-containing protein [Aequitasia blattaphilus]